MDSCDLSSPTSSACGGLASVHDAHRQAFSTTREAQLGRADHPAQNGVAAGFRVALFSGNYNCVRDGANNALNHLARYLLDEDAALRICSPTAPHPAFAAVGTLVSVPSIPLPFRPEYRLATGPGRAIRADIRRFSPNIVHLSAPDLLGWRAQRFARKRGVAVVATLHTRFETYLDYYGLPLMRGPIECYLRRFYGDCDLVLVPNEGMAELLRTWGLGHRVRLWSRGVDRMLFSPRRRDMAWRQSRGIANDDVTLLFFGRLVREKGLDMFAAATAVLRARGVGIRPLVVGDGPARASFAAMLGDAIFTGHLDGVDLANAIASADILLNPSLTEAFGNVNLEAMASGVAVVSADVPSSRSLITHGRDGLLAASHQASAYADAVEELVRNPLRRRSIGCRASARASHFKWPTTLRAVVEAYREVVAPKPLCWDELECAAAE